MNLFREGGKFVFPTMTGKDDPTISCSDLMTKLRVYLHCVNEILFF